MDTLTTHRHRSLTHPSCVPLTCSPSLDACIDWARGSSSTLISFEVRETVRGYPMSATVVPSGLTCEKEPLYRPQKIDAAIFCD